MTPRLLVFASGDKDGGGSGFANLVAAMHDGRLSANIVGVVSNWPAGGVAEKAGRLGIPFIHMSPPYTAEHYQQVVRDSGSQIVTLSGWLKKVLGLEDDTTNIHPGYLGLPLPEGAGPYGGDGMYGHYVHEKVMADIRAGLIPPYSAVTMHFVPSRPPTEPAEKVLYDTGPICFRKLVEVDPNWTAGELAQAVNRVEHEWQPEIVNAVVNGKIRNVHGWVFILPHWVLVEDMPTAT